MSIYPDLRLTLYKYKLIEVFAELKLERATVFLWFEKEYLSFNADDKDEIEYSEYLEIVFVNSLFNSGLSLHSIEHILSKLKKPYAYNPTKVYYDFIGREWEYFPEPIQQVNLDKENYYEEITSLLDQLDIEDEKTTLQLLVDDLNEMLSEIK